MMLGRPVFRAGRVTILISSAIVAIAIVLLRAPRASRHDLSTIVRIDSTRVAGITNGLTILMYADGDATVRFGAGDPHRLTDTLRLIAAPDFTADVSRGAVHMEMVAGQLERGGVIALRGARIDTRMDRRDRTVTGVGRHLVLEQGGRGIRVVDRGNAELLHDWQ